MLLLSVCCVELVRSVVFFCAGWGQSGRGSSGWTRGPLNSNSQSPTISWELNLRPNGKKSVCYIQKQIIHNQRLSSISLQPHKLICTVLNDFTTVSCCIANCCQINWMKIYANTNTFFRLINLLQIFIRLWLTDIGACFYNYYIIFVFNRNCFSCYCNQFQFAVNRVFIVTVWW